jgi:CHAT domain-containing protein
VAAAVACSAVAVAAPKTPPKGPPAKSAEQVELDALDKEYLALITKQQNFAVVKVLRKAYDKQKKLSGEDSPDTQRRKQLLASMMTVIGDYADATTLYKEMLALAEKQHGPESREVVTTLSSLTGVYWGQNRVDELEPLYQRMLAVTKKLDGENSQAYALQLSTYATLLNTRNEYSSAQRLYEQEVKILEGLGPDQPMLPSAYQVLAGVYWQTNQKPKAIALYDKVIKLSETGKSSTPMTQAGTAWGVAAMYHYGGRDDLAAPLSKKAIDIYLKEIDRLEKANPNDVLLPTYYGSLGYLYRQQNDLPNADKYLTKGYDIDKKSRGYSGWLGALADLRRAQGRFKDALAMYEESKAQLVKVAPQSANAYDSVMADVLREMGDYKRAETLLLSYRAYIEKLYGKRHPTYGMAEVMIAYVYMASGRAAEAEKYLTDGLELAERDLINVLRTGTESDHAIFFSRNGYLLDTAINFELNVAPTSASAARLGLTTLLRRKGRVLDAAAASLATIRSKLSPDDKKLLDDLASARAKLAKLEVAGPSATAEGEYAKEVAALEDQIQKLEIAVGQKSAAYRASSQTIDLASVQKLIPRDGKLVEIVNFQPGDLKQVYKLNQVLPARHYAAYVVGPTGNPTLTDLGPAPAIDDAIEKFRKALSDHALYALTFAKLMTALGTTNNVLLAPDGALNVVPFSALVDDNKQFLIKRFTFTYLTSGRDLLRLNVKTKAQGGGVIFADPAFDATGKPAPAPAAGGTRGRRSADLASLSWPPLPGTGQEADAVEKTMHGLKVYRGADATETAIKQIHGPRIVHLATHGFFLPDEAPPPTPTNDNRAGMPAMPGAPAAPAETYENPLLRSGLAFAGANKLVSGDDDGILTAMEATGLDLQGTKLVVLSACETGNGKVTNGDGVYGLRRALVIAGAESLVMTLWQVDDLATRDLMTGYYAKLQAGKRRSSALRDVQLEISARAKYAHPYYWASFLPAGDNSPIKE